MVYSPCRHDANTASAGPKRNCVGHVGGARIGTRTNSAHRLSLDGARILRGKQQPYENNPSGGRAVGAGRGLNEPLLLSHLMKLLQDRPRHSLLLSDVGALLPWALRHGVKGHGGLRSWLVKFPHLFLIFGTPGKELVTLCLNKTKHGTLSEAGGSEFEVAATQDSRDGAWGEQGRQEEDKDNDSSVQMRGLPFCATAQDIRNFLGNHVHSLKDEESVQLVFSRDGRPSGFAIVQFNSPEAAKAAREDLHMRVLEVSDSNGAIAAGQGRYIEVFLFSDRLPNLKNRRIQIERSIDHEGTEADASCSSKDDQLILEIRAHLASHGNGRMLMSMLGVALSQEARDYLRTSHQGLKNVLEKYASEFTMEGPKGREYVAYLPTCKTNHSREDLPSLPSSPHVGDEPTFAEELVTPSDWGTPDPAAYAGLRRPYSGADLREASLAASPSSDWLASAEARMNEWPGQGAGCPLNELWKLETTFPAATSAPAAQNHVFQMSDEPPGVLLSGLPINCTEHDVLTFFSRFDIVDRVSEAPHCVQIFKEAQQAVVQMLSRTDAHAALRLLKGQEMDGHSIDVSHYTCGQRGSAEPQSACKSSVTDKSNSIRFLELQHLQQPEHQQCQDIPVPGGCSGASETGGSSGTSEFVDWVVKMRAPDGLLDSNPGVAAFSNPGSHRRDVLTVPFEVESKSALAEGRQKTSWGAFLSSDATLLDTDLASASMW